MARIFVLNGVNLGSLGERPPEVEFRQADHSYAIHDALEAVSVPKVEVHLSNVRSREEVWRHTSVVSPVVDAVVTGMGVYGYRAAAGYVLSVGPSEL